MELILKTGIEQLVPAAIEFNFDEMKAELEQKLKRYNDLVVTENAIKEAKTDKASLNSLAKTLSDNRIANERVYMQPFNEYKAKINQLIALIKEPVAAIDVQIKGFEDKEKEVKLNEITQFYKSNIGNLINILPLDKILNPKWANKGTTLLSITQELIDKIITVQNDLKVIDAMKLDCETQVKDAYLKSLSMSDALAEKARFEERKKRLEELKTQNINTKSDENQEAESEPRRVGKSFVPSANLAETTTNVPQQASNLRTITATFFDTTAAFRAEMTELINKHNIVCK